MASTPDVHEGFPSCEAFVSWAGNARMLEGDHLTADDFSGPGPFVVRVFHGTTHAFDRFDAAPFGNTDAQFGAVHYFTTDPWDAWTHYASNAGPDLKSRIALRAERLVNEMEDDPESFGLGEDDDVEAIAAQKAEAELVGPHNLLLDLVVRLERPFVVGGPTRWRIPGLTPWDEISEGIEGIDIDEDEDAWNEAHDAAYTEQSDLLRNAFDAASRALGMESVPVPDRLLDERFDGTSQDLENAIEKDLYHIDHPETGDLMSHAFFGELIRALGFDSIVLLRADARFRSMRMNAGTTHVHLFDPLVGGQAKLWTASGFNPQDPRLDA